MRLPKAGPRLGLACAIGLTWLGGSHSAAAQVVEDREKAVMGRFLAVLEKAPRRGTALDRVYGYHVERGELDALIKTYQDRSAKDPKDGQAWLLLGLIESQRGRDAAAVAAFRKSEECRPDEALPAYYLGQALVLVGQPDAAAEAFERALARRPSRVDMLEIFQALGRVHQRARRDDKALDVWDRLEKLFPDDPRVQEQIASALAEESRLEPALARYEALAASARDPYRRVRFRTVAADLKVRLRRQAEALRDYEGLLAGLDPESWLFREVRRKVEEVFLRDDDQAGLAKYYERWVEKSPEDVDAMTRLAKALASQGRAPEARTWLDRALKLAPSNKGLRLALIEQLAKERDFAGAAAQYEAMARVEPNNPDVIRDWGRMLLRDASKPEADRKRSATAVWRRLVEARPDDPSAAAQAAELFRQAGLVDEAIVLYRKAVDLAPTSPQYREYLGEYYHSLKRPEEALATWRQVAEGPGRDAAALGRLGEVLAGFGYKAEAIEAVDQACRLDPGSFRPRVRLADLLLEARRFDDADAQLALADPLAEDDDRREEVLARRIALDEAAGRLPGRLAALQAEVAGPKAGDPSSWRTLARYAEAARRPIDAVAAAEKAVALDGRSVANRATLARLYEATGRFGEAAESFRVLASIDRRARVEHLTNSARLEARLGRRDEALKVGRELLAAAPGNPENLQFFSDLCFQLGENEEGLETLRRAVRANESDVKALTNLAEALAREFRTEEAIELFWRAFERTEDLDLRLGMVERLADLHLRRNQFDRLTARLERLQGEDDRRRDASFFLARAYATLGDFGTARHQLEGLLEANPRDTALLKQLAKLAEDEGDLPSAVKFLKQSHEVAPSDDSAFRLAQLAIRAGEVDVAEALWSKATDPGQDLSRVLLALDSLIGHGRYEAVLATTGRLLSKDPANWEVLHREARTYAAMGRPDEAARRFEAILGLRRDDDEVSSIVKARRKAPPQPAAGSPVAARAMIESTGIRYRITAARTVRLVSGLEPGYPLSLTNAWGPADFGQARLSALAGLLARARRDGTEADWLAKRRPKDVRGPVDPRAAWDDYYVSLLRNEAREPYESAKALAKAAGRDPSAGYALIWAMTSRDVAPFSTRTVVRTGEDDAPDLTPPLPAEDLDLIRDAFRMVVRSNAGWLYEWLIDTVQAELKRAGRLGEIDPDYRFLVDSAHDVGTISLAASAAADRGDLDALLKLNDAFHRLPVGGRSTSLSPNQPYYIWTPQGAATIPGYSLARAMQVKADARAYAEILRLLDDELDAVRSPSRVAERARASKAAPSSTAASASATLSTRTVYPVFTTRSSTMVTIDYPTPGRYLDGGSILLLRNAFALFKRDDLLSDLLAHLRKRADGASKDPSAELYARLELSAVLWWAEDKDAALRELARASQLVPGDVDLKLLMAELRAQRREPDEALAIVDSVDATDQDVTRRRELLALRLAVQTGRADRARQAAERLFGLRLDGATQVQLAAQMQQLGMLDLADAVLSRARRQVGNNNESLLGLMAQYQRQGNADAAVQVALQLLRRSSGQALRVGEVEDPANRPAIQVLAASGKLQEMIDRSEAQLKLSPLSLPLHQMLAAYYRAAGQSEKLKATYQSIARLRPDDAPLRIQMATQLMQSGEVAAALDQYRDLLKKDPSLLSAYSGSIFAAFQQANRVDELIKLLDQVGLKAIGDHFAIRTLITPLLQDPKTLDQGVALLGRAWEAFPKDRASILFPLVPLEPFWKRPDSYQFAKGAVIPGDGAIVGEAWFGLDEMIAVGGWGLDGKILTSATRLLDAASRQGSLDALAAEVEAAIGRRAGWQAGRVLLGAIRLRQGRIDEGRRILTGLLANPVARPPFEVLMFLGQESRDLPALEAIAVTCYEKAVKVDRSWTYASLYIKASAVRHLALLYRKAGRPEEARGLAAQAEARLKGLVGSTNSTLSSYRRLTCLEGLGQLFLDLGDPADALRVFDEFLGSTDDIQAARGYPTRDVLPGVDAILLQVRQGVDRLLGGLNRETLASTLKTLIRAEGEGKRVDLLLVVSPREVDQAAVMSLLSASLDLASRDPSTLARVKADLEAIEKARPDDLETRVALALLAGLGGDPGAVAAAALAIDRLADESPLEVLPTVGRANARQRQEAAHRLGLWLVARACWGHDSTAEVGDRLASKALEAARRMADPTWTLAMLREQGQRALDRGDRPGAEARWSSLLDLIMADPLAPTAPPSAVAPGRSNPATARPRVPALSVDRFRQAAEFSRLAADHGMGDLALKAIRESLKGGPPIVPVAMASTPTPVVRALASAEPPPDPALQLVEAKLVELDALWTRAKVDPPAAYETLRDVVLPAARPGEILLYDPASARPGRTPSTVAPSADPTRPGQVGKILARRAVDADRVDDLRKRIAARQESPTAKAPAQRLLAAIDEALKAR